MTYSFDITILTSCLIGTVINDLYKDTYCLILKKVGSEKHEMAIRDDIVCVTILWLYDCHDKQRLVSRSLYRVKPFHGLVITVTQLSPREKERTEILIQENGGIYSGKLEFEVTTHLIASTPDGDKYFAAKEWGLPIVTMSWLHDCIDKNHWLKERNYQLRNKLQRLSSSSSSLLLGQQPVPETASNTVKIIIPTIPPRAQVNPEKCNILQNEVFFISGFSNDIKESIVQLVLAGGGKRHQVLTPHVTKILLGDKTDYKLEQEVKKHPCGAVRVKVQWLIDLLTS